MPLRKPSFVFAGSSHPRIAQRARKPQMEAVLQRASCQCTCRNCANDIRTLLWRTLASKKRGGQPQIYQKSVRAIPTFTVNPRDEECNLQLLETVYLMGSSFSRKLCPSAHIGGQVLTSEGKICSHRGCCPLWGLSARLPSMIDYMTRKILPGHKR